MSGRRVQLHLLVVVALTLALVNCGGLASDAPGNSGSSGGSSSILSISTNALPDGQVQVFYQASLAAQGGTAPYAWSMLSGQLPSGLSLNGTGEISGTPTEVGQLSFTVQVTDSSQSAQTATKALALTIAAVAQLQVVTNGLPTGRIAEPYQATMTSTGGVTPYTWRMVAGALPLGLLLGAASGDISGTPSEAGQFSITVEVEDSSQPTPQTATKTFDLSVVEGELDQYGGLVGRPCDGGATGFFNVEQQARDGRWMLCTPEGNSFWLRSVHLMESSVGAGGIGYRNRVIAKYGDAQFAWGNQTTKRTKAWDFNAIGLFWSRYVLPVGTLGSNRTNDTKMPFTHMLRPARDFMEGTNCDGHISESGKDLFLGVDNTVLGNRNLGADEFPDVFNPEWLTCVTGKLNDNNSFFTNGLANEPWYIGTVLEQVDQLGGFGSSPEWPAAGGSMHPHLGWVVLAMCPNQRTNAPNCGSGGSVVYSDTEVFTKTDWIAWLKGRYATIADLNTAWGTNYSAFDGGGCAGWPTSSAPNGGCLVDDDGTNWIGNLCWRDLACMTATMRQDLDDYLERLSEGYFKAANQIRALLPNHLVFGPSPLGGKEGGPRRPILRAAARFVDVIELSISPDNPAPLQGAYEETGKPIIAWVGYVSNGDSPHPGCPLASLCFATQEARGTRYQRMIDVLLNTSVNGIFPGVGLGWFSWVDKVSENANWGLVSSPLDNAYDGGEAIIAEGTDPWGFPTGGEAADYGDFISAVRNANLKVLQVLLGNNPP